jgi:hypothetical protein
MQVQPISFKNNILANHFEQRISSSNPIITVQQPSDKIELSSKKKKVIEYSLIGVGIVGTGFTIIKHKQIGQFLKGAPRKLGNELWFSKSTTKPLPPFKPQIEPPESNYLSSLTDNQKNAVKLMVNSWLSLEYAEIFVKLNNIADKKNFAKEAFKLLINKEYDEGMAPIFKINPLTAFNPHGMWEPSEFSVNLYEGYSFALKTPVVLNLMTHEIEHSKQSLLMLRTEGIGTEELLKASAKISLNDARIDDPESSLKKFGKLPNDVTIQDIEKYYNFNEAKIRLKKIEEYYRKKLGIVTAASPDGKLAYEYLDAYHNYITVNPRASKEVQEEQMVKYVNNPLERDAYKAGNKIQELYEKFIIWLEE